MEARDVMSRDVPTVTPQTSVIDAAKLLLSRHLGAVPVIDDSGHLAGIVSEADLLHRAETGTIHERSWWLRAITPAEVLAREYVKSHARQVGDVMSRDVVSVGENAELGNVADMMEDHRVRTIVVVRDRKPVGLISRGNLLQLFVGRALSPGPRHRDDAAIRQRVVDEFRQQPWAGLWSSNVIVHDGIVHLWGWAPSESVRDACRVAAESVPDVKAVENHIHVPKLISMGM
jgi:CBS-domain-containing membrane protein